MQEVYFIYQKKACSGISEQCSQICNVINEIDGLRLTSYDVNEQFKIIDPPRGKANTIIVGLNPPETNQVFLNHNLLKHNATRIIVYCAWEFDSISPDWDFSNVDEIWTISEFSKAGIQRKCNKPIHVIVSPIVEFSITPFNFKLPRGFRFLVCFDYMSDVYRKNISETIEVFNVFLNNPVYNHVYLIVKSINDDKVPVLSSYVKSLANCERIIFITDEVSKKENNYLKTICDAYISLHRAEGWGRNIAEMLYAGKPVISTYYSGEKEFLTQQNAYIIGHKEVPVASLDSFQNHLIGTDDVENLYIAGLYKTRFPTGKWAQPDLQQALVHMENVVNFRLPHKQPFLHQNIGTISDRIRERFDDLVIQKVRNYPQIYLERYPDLIRAGLKSDTDALTHWKTYGIKEGRIW